MRKMMIAVAAALALGTATMATGTMAFGRGGGGGGGHFGGLYRFGGALPYYGYGYGSCYALTPYGYASVCN